MYKNIEIIKKNYLILLIYYILFSFDIVYSQNENDSINIWINQSKNKKLETQTRKKILIKAYRYIQYNKINASRELSNIAYEFYNLKDTLNFFKINNTAIEISRRNNDLFANGDAHWNYALYYEKNQIYDKSFEHYHKGYKSFNKGNFKLETARMLFGMAYIKGRFKDYIGSEVLTFEAIKKFKDLENYKHLCRAYNHLGQLQREINEYDKALNYYIKALAYFNKIKNKKHRAIHNNIANIYLEKGNYHKAIKNYNKELKNNLSRSQYARVTDNKAYCKLLMEDTLGIKKDFFKALQIRDSLKNKTDILMSKIRISDYYNYIQDTTKALKYAKEANMLAKKVKNGRDYLVSLQQLANLDTRNSKKYLDRYIQFNDSLISQERKAQNKFTRIEFETDEHIADKKRLNEQRVWIFAASIALLLILSLLYYVRVQKVQNEKLQLEAEQQQANEEVYVLTLQQQAKLEEERVNERNRISAELHDGILGKLFGTRVSLGFLGMQMQPDTQEQHQTFLDELQTIEKEIRDVSHRLSENFDDATVNFSSIIEQLLKDKSVIGSFTYTFTPDPTILWKSINEITKANIYRIIQEALQNIIKHANAKSVILDFSLHQQRVVIKIQDDGVGFDAKKGKKGIGIKNIKTRVEKLSGSVDFISEINKGTTLLIYIPYFPQNAA